MLCFDVVALWRCGVAAFRRYSFIFIATLHCRIYEATNEEQIACTVNVKSHRLGLNSTTGRKSGGQAGNSLRHEILVNFE